MRCLALVIAVFVSWTAVDSPRSFASESVSPNPNLVHITPAILERKVTQIRELFFGNIFRFLAPDGRGVILSTPDSLGEVHVDDETGIKSKMEGSPLHVTCPDSASAVLRPIFLNYPLSNTRKFRTTIHYGKLALHFISAPAPYDSLCTLVSQRGALPIIADFRVDPGTGLAVASQQIAASITTATLDFIPTRTDIRHCDLSLMESLSRADLIDSTKPLPNGSEKCYLNEPGTAATNGLTVRWSIPGFEEYTPDEHGLRVYKTQSLTYYVDLNSLLATNDVRSINSLVVDCLENYIHQTLIKNLPAITPIGIAQLWPAV
jgi:hypothetical protein